MKQAIIVLVSCLTAPGLAHELRPAYLDVYEEKAGKFRVLWKTPMAAARRWSATR
jgi:hypothetical protein